MSKKLACFALNIMVCHFICKFCKLDCDFWACILYFVLITHHSICMVFHKIAS